MDINLEKFSKASKENILYWLNGNITKEEKNFILQNIKTNPKEIENSFSKKIAFGTAGIRAKMGIGTNRLNKYIIRGASLALANYLKKGSVIIGYDNRKNSKMFAEEAAKVLAYNKIKVFLFKTLTPTPLVSYGCRLKKCSSAIMITASHNTKEYNGFKVYGSDGAQIVSPQDKDIIEEFNKIKDIFSIKTSPLKSPFIELIQEEIEDSYIKTLSKIFEDTSFIKKKGKNIKILYTPLHGTGIKILPKALKKYGFTNFSLVEKQSKIDENFSYAKSPNPENKEALKMGINQMIKENKDIFIATDPDADRMAAIINHKNKPFILTGNQIACIILEHILKNKTIPKNSAFIKTIVTTELFSKIASFHKKNVFDVLTGFKYIAEKIRIWEQEKSYKFIFGAEESLGFLYGDFVRDKDSTIASCIFLEALIYKHPFTLFDMLYDIYKKYGIYRETLININFSEDENMMKKIMSSLRKNPLKSFANYEITIQEDYQTKIKKDYRKNKTFKIDLPASNVLRYFLDDNTKIVIRPSGTEPKIKIYIGVNENNFSSVEEGIKLSDERLKALSSAVKNKLQSIISQDI